MTFEFLVTCEIPPEQELMDIRQFLTDALSEILENNQNDFEDETINSMVQIHHNRQVSVNSFGSRNNLIGFILELPEDTENVGNVIAEFSEYILDNPPISHVVKFEDPLLLAYLAEHAVEISALEMKLRRVLSLIYLNAYELRGAFNLLRGEQVQPPPPERLTEKEMKDLVENQFYRLNFSDYIRLNQRSAPSLQSVLSLIRETGSYHSLRTEIVRLDRDPVEETDDVNFISSIRRIMDPIEKMRNCVAHNRHPTTDVVASYPTARDELNRQLDDYLARWEVQE